MSKLAFDYSKWDRLELSDDEDTFHPNLDKNLNIRVNRASRDRKEEEIDMEKKKYEAEGRKDKAEQIEAKRPLHVGNVCRVAEERTIVNWSNGSRKDRTVKDGEEFSVDAYFEFKRDHQKIFEEFTEADWEQSHQMLADHGGILFDDCANHYFLFTALDAETEGNTEQVLKLGRQGQIISQIQQLAKPMNRHPRDLVHRFFDRCNCDEARHSFQEGVDQFLGHIRRRAVEKKREAEEEAAREAAKGTESAQPGERQPVPLVEAMYMMSPEKRRGPGGLDPVEVFESLPESIQQCFGSGNAEQLQAVADEMEPEEFEGHFKRCIDSGLWRPG